MLSEWFYKTAEAEIGPVTANQLLSLAQSGTVLPSTLVRKGKEGQWVAANRIKGLFADVQPIGSATTESNPENVGRQLPPPLPSSFHFKKDEAVSHSKDTVDRRDTVFISLPKLLLIIAVVCGVCGILIFQPSRSKDEPLTESELLFLKDVRDVDNHNWNVIRSWLARDDLNWKHVATPALSSIIEHEWECVGDHQCISPQWSSFWTGVAERMIAKGADVNTAYLKSYSTGDAGTLRFLVEHGLDVNASEMDGDTVLIRSAWDDRYCNNVKFLIDKGADVNKVGDEGNTPLHTAAQGNAVKVIELLISHGANVNAKNKRGQTPLAVSNLALQKQAADLLKSKGGTE